MNGLNKNNNNDTKCSNEKGDGKLWNFEKKNSWTRKRNKILNVKCKTRENNSLNKK